MSVLFPWTYTLTHVKSKAWQMLCRVTAADFQFAVSVEISCMLWPREGTACTFQSASLANSPICNRNLSAKFTAKVKDVRSSVNSVDVRRRVCTFGSKTKGNIGGCSSSFLVWTRKPLLCLLAAQTAARGHCRRAAELQVWLRRFASGVATEHCLCSEKTSSIKLYGS